MLHAQVVFGVAQLGLASKLPLSKWLVLGNLHLPDYKVGYASLSPCVVLQRLQELVLEW